MSDSEEDKKNVLPFHEMGLDDRILKAVAKLGWIEPTLIQVTRWLYPRGSVADPDPTFVLQEIIPDRSCSIS
jgi:hypothetical protein